MSEIHATCTCGKAIALPMEGRRSRLLERMARLVMCDECAERAELEEREREAADRLQAREARRSRCQLPPRLRGELLAHFPARPEQRRAVEAAAKWAAGTLHGLMLTGPVGTGKTRIAAAACWTRLEHAPCTYVSVARAMSLLTASLHDQARNEAVRLLHGKGAVVLDDLDKARVTEFGKEQIFAAIDAREQHGAPILVTTNLAPSELAERYGDAVASRLVGYCTPIEVGGEDLRLEAAA